MSSQLRIAGLWWDGQRGRFKHDDVEAALRRAPTLGGVRIDRIEFDPAMKVQTLAVRSIDPRRDMTPDEIEEAHLWLLRASSHLRSLIG